MPLLSLANPLPRPDLTEVEYDLIQRFSLLSEDQRSYRSVFTPERLRKYDFYSPFPGKVVGILDFAFFFLLAF